MANVAEASVKMLENTNMPVESWLSVELSRFCNVE